VVVAVVAILIWAIPKSSDPASPAASLSNLASENQALLATNTADAQQTATADILFAHDRATNSAATSTRDAAQAQFVLQQTQVLLQQTQVVAQQTRAQFSLALTADSATQSTGATAVQQQANQSLAGTTIAIAQISASQTQAVIVTQQAQTAQLRQDEIQQRDTLAFIWAWGPALFLFVVLVIGIWAFWYWEVHNRISGQSERVKTTAVPTLPKILISTQPVIEPVLITQPDGQVGEWLAEVKENYLPQTRQTMTIQPLDPHHFNKKVLQIRAHVPTALTQHGLQPRFTSWRLTQDPTTGLVVLFASLNDEYITEHSPTGAEDYCDPQLLHALATDLQVQVVPSQKDGLRYAFILDRGQLGQPPPIQGSSGLQ